MIWSAKVKWREVFNHKIACDLDDESCDLKKQQMLR